jgi:hypothetical protein
MALVAVSLPRVISVMTGCEHLIYNSSWKCQQIAAEQLLTRQMVQSIRASGMDHKVHFFTRDG